MSRVALSGIALGAFVAACDGAGPDAGPGEVGVFMQPDATGTPRAVSITR